MKPRGMASSLTARVLTVSALLAGVLAVIGAGAAASPAGAASPALTITPTSLVFGSVTLGDVAVQSFVFTNTGGEPDAISPTAAFSGPDGNDFIGVPESSCPNDGTQIVLQPTDTCTVDVVFIPGGLGVRSTSITFSDTLDSDASISLSGTGTIGYYQVSSAGKVAAFGDAQLFGDASQLPLNSPIVSMAQTGDNGGYWLVASDGGIFSYGDAGFFGSAGSIRLNKPVVGMASTADGQGYWQVASDGGIFTYGDASFFGSTGSIALNKPIVGMAPTPDGGGYWLVASDGGIFAYGDATFFGSTGSIHLNQPVVGMAPTPDGGGYWLVASDGGIFAYGDATFFGSTGSIHLNEPIVGMTAMPDGSGYWFTAADGGLFNYGDAPFYGSSAGQGLGQVVAMTTDGLPTAQAIADVPGLRADIPALRGDHLPAWHAPGSTRHGLSEAPSRPRGHRAGAGRPSAQDDGVPVHLDGDRGPLEVAALEQGQGQRVLDAALEHPAQRPGPVVGVVAGPGQPVLGCLRDHQ